MKKNNLYITILLILSVSFYLILGLGGEYPLGDDWSFNYALKHLIEKGDLYLTGWTSMPLLTQLLTGYIFSLGEFSFQNARISTIILSFISVFLVYYISKELGASNKNSFINSLFLITNPLFIHFAFSFNTDSNYIFWFLLYLFLVIKYINNKSNIILVSSFFVFIFSILLRDLTFIIPLAIILYEFINYFKFKLINKRNIIISIIFIFIFIIVSSLYKYYLEYNNILPELYYFQKNILFNNLLNPIQLIIIIIKSFVKILCYISIYFFIPYFILNVNKSYFKNKKYLFYSFLISVFIVLINIFLYKVKLFNFIFSDFILDYEFNGSYLQLQILTNIILFLSFNSMLLSLFNFYFKEGFKINNNRLIILICAILYFALFTLVPPFARYFIILIPLLAIYFNKSKINNINFISIIIFFTFLSYFMTIPISIDNHKFVSKHWSEAKKLEAEGIPSDSINAGFEYSGWHHYEKSDKELHNNVFIQNSKYLISIFKFDNYIVIDSSKIKYKNIIKKDTFIYTQIRKD